MSVFRVSGAGSRCLLGGGRWLYHWGLGVGMLRAVETRAFPSFWGHKLSVARAASDRGNGRVC